MNSDVVSTFLRQQQIDAWWVYDFRGSNPVLAELLPGQRWTTRRLMLVVRCDARPLLVVHHIDAPQFAGAGVDLHVYRDRHGWLDTLRSLAVGQRRIAMEYSPMGELPAAAIVAPGTVELVRSLGPDVVSSADVVQFAVAKWDAAARSLHQDAADKCVAVMHESFDLVRRSIRDAKPIDELVVQQFILERLTSLGLDPDHPPIVGVNAHSGDPHFEVSATSPAAIRRGDWLLIDLWARHPGRQNVFADITWVGYAGDDIPTAYRRAFDAVAGARDAALALAIERFAKGASVQGFELDVAAGDVLKRHGFADAIRHRTGHSLSPGPKIHGLGANLDDFETRDTRQMLPGTGFTIEPAIYLPEFGCRLEIDVFIDPASGPIATTELQRDIVRLA
jgi:Xaa-Pro dipeptidase